MPVTLEEVRAALAPDEPDYQRAAAALGVEALPHLATLVREGGLEMAAKAASLAAYIQDEGALQVLSMAAESKHPVVRVAAAAGLPRLADFNTENTLVALLDDVDPGVRRIALKSAPSKAGAAEVEARVARIADNDPTPWNRKLAAEVQQELRGAG